MKLIILLVYKKIAKKKPHQLKKRIEAKFQAKKRILKLQIIRIKFKIRFMIK